MPKCANPTRLNPRDLRLLQALYEGRFITNGQAGKYIWGHINSANRRLGELERAGLIGRSHDCELRETVIRPTPAGIRGLVDHGLISNDQAKASWTWKHLHPKPRDKDDQPRISFICHEAKCNEVALALRHLSRQGRNGLQVVSHLAGPQLWDKIVLDERDYQIRPDRLLVLKLPGFTSRQYVFVEVDRGTRSIGKRCGWDVINQLRAYDAYLAGGGFVARYAQDEPQEPPFRVLFLTISKRRIANILQHLTGRSIATRAYGLRSEFVADPLGQVLRPEANPYAECSLLDRWTTPVIERTVRRGKSRVINLAPLALPAPT